MAKLTADQLQYRYQWHAIPPDDPRRTGRPDSTLLNRGEGYEVVDFINRYCDLRTWSNPSGPATLATRQKVERLIHQVPSNLRSHSNVAAWIHANWGSFA